MAAATGRRLVVSLQRRLFRRRLGRAAAVFLLGLAPLEVLLIRWAGVSALWLPGAAAAALAVAAAWLWARSDIADSVRTLDRAVPELEESAELLLATDSGLAPLARLQRVRALRAVAQLDSSEIRLEGLSSGDWRRLIALSVGVSLAVWLTVPARGLGGPGGAAGDEYPNPERALHVEALIQPPDYMNRPERLEVGLEFTVEQGAEVLWRVTGLDADLDARLVFDDGDLPLTRDSAGSAGSVAASRRVDSSRLYYLATFESGTGQPRYRGPYARLTIKEDEEPRIDITEPRLFTLLPEAGSNRLGLRAEISDDYGVTRVSLTGTVATGSGELVEFRERRLSFPRREGNERRAVYARVFDLGELGLVPGSDFYFYIEAIDNRSPDPNVSRSPTHIVRRSGGRGASVGLGDGIPVFAVPDLFRSQRQIILDTEKLLAEAETVTEAEFARRSEGLGFDQRALRLRYGVLLGQEFVDGRPLTEEEEALEFEDDEELGELVGALPEGVVHQHDPNDLNTFFDSEVRERMRAALEEMWGAEGQLRTHQPRRALPYEYRALALLKQAQERSRIYVQKVGFDVPPLEPRAKRLTGDLTKIRSRSVGRRVEPPSPDTAELILVGLRALQAGELPVEQAADLLQQARSEILAGALADSGADLRALEAAAELESAVLEEGRADPEQLELVTEELAKRLPVPEQRAGRAAPAPSKLLTRYLAGLREAGSLGGEAGDG